MNPSPVARCGTHAKELGAIVCSHHLQATSRVLGFIENCTDAANLQAWCDECERLFISEEGMTEAFRKFNDFKVVCSECYANARAKHSPIASNPNARGQ
jgi:hypothetical protein